LIGERVSAVESLFDRRIRVPFSEPLSRWRERGWGEGVFY
jgi:hypothetical protein